MADDLMTHVTIYISQSVLLGCMLVQMIFVPANQHWNMGMMDNVVADAAEECAPYFTHTPGSRHNKTGMLIACNFTDYLPWVTTNTFHFTTNLKRNKENIPYASFFKLMLNLK